MRLLDQAGLAKPLDDLRLDIRGYVEASVTNHLSGPARAEPLLGGRVNFNRRFDFEDADPTLDQVALTFERPVAFRRARRSTSGSASTRSSAATPGSSTPTG